MRRIKNIQEGISVAESILSNPSSRRADGRLLRKTERKISKITSRIAYLSQFETVNFNNLN
jgi:hypothetical protein